MPLVSKTFSQIITFTRASTATFFNSAGVLTSAAIDAPRFDFNPSTLAAQGLLIEEARTNSIRNNTMVGAVAGTPGTLPTNWAESLSGLTREVVGTGTTNGITWIDIKLSGTTSGTGATLQFESITQITAATSQTWAGSIYALQVSGSQTNITNIQNRIFERTSAGVFLASTDVAIQSSIASGTLVNNRFSVIRTLSDATAARVTSGITLNFSSGVAIDVTLRIGLPQLELGAFATSVIPTTTTALTRSADVASVNTLSPWYNSASGTLYVECVTFDSLTSAFPSGAVFSDGTAGNRIGVIRNNLSGNSRGNVVVGGAAQFAADATTWTLNATTKNALAYATNDFALVTNGGAATTDTSGTLPTIDRLRLGVDATASGFWLNGYLRRVSYFPRRLSNAELQTLTS
jgi:hypothetical protein